ncbi:MFS general substrate transporter [Ramaria rubella]|nr:MFS general substrate transporter [Ramaria rubella]
MPQTAVTSSITCSNDVQRVASPDDTLPTERDPLIVSSSSSKRLERIKKPWYRARPLWIAPFAVTASLCRGMTLAPRTEVFIQLACEEFSQGRHHHTSQHKHIQSLYTTFPNHHYPTSDADKKYTHLLIDRDPIVTLPSVEKPTSKSGSVDDKDPPDEKVRPVNCSANPAVQAGAAKLQTIMTTIMGLLSALTTGWWGQFGDQRGRTKVIASATFGLLFTDVMFLIASNPPEILRGRAHTLLLVAPVLEGLLGGWSTLQGATHAYISDCTSAGSRAQIFSRFTGVFHVGLALGPEIAALLLRSTHSTTKVFRTSVVCAFINLFLLLFVFPESLDKETREQNIKAAKEAKEKALQAAHGKRGLWRPVKTALKTFVEPLGILGPKLRERGRGLDWTLTLVSLSMFTFYLSLGLNQMKYLYAKHVFSWDGETLSYYITAVGTARALHLLLILPTIIRLLKPPPVVNASQPTSTTQGKKVAPTPKGLLAEIKFDLLVAKVSAVVDILSHVLATLALISSEALFVGFTTISSFGAGMTPALQSVAMSTLYLREGGGQNNEGPSKGGAEVGKLFGAFSVVQAVGSMILGPMLFGTVYSTTVRSYPKAIFVVAAGLLLVSLAMLLLIRPPRVDIPIEIRVETEVLVEVERLRGRSRQSKDIGAGLYYDIE